jgi:hypothetical protein
LGAEIPTRRNSDFPIRKVDEMSHFLVLRKSPANQIRKLAVETSIAGRALNEVPRGTSISAHPLDPQVHRREARDPHGNKMEMFPA